MREAVQIIHRIVEFMKAKSARVVAGDAWYLSIVAVDPAPQGKGLGRKLLEPTIAEADRVGATCFLETFSPRNLSFYEQLGFASEARFTRTDYGRGVCGDGPQSQGSNGGRHPLNRTSEMWGTSEECVA